MKVDLLFRLGAAVLLVCTLARAARGQGTFIYDQQSSDESNLGGGATSIQSTQPMGQSFTPTLTSVGFVRLFLSDDAFNGLGATIQLSLRSNSITGPLMAVSDPVVLPDHFIGATNFLFTTPAPVVPGVTYYFQPVIQSGDSFSAYAYNSFGYAGGTEYINGVVFPNFDLWFREGIVVPEPSSLSLAAIAAVMFAFRRRFARNRRAGKANG